VKKREKVQATPKETDATTKNRPKRDKEAMDTERPEPDVPFKSDDDDSTPPRKTKRAGKDRYGTITGHPAQSLARLIKAHSLAVGEPRAEATNRRVKQKSRPEVAEKTKRNKKDTKQFEPDVLFKPDNNDQIIPRIKQVTNK
jgi:hypothetical protein